MVVLFEGPYWNSVGDSEKDKQMGRTTEEGIKEMPQFCQRWIALKTDFSRVKNF